MSIFQNHLFFSCNVGLWGSCPSAAWGGTSCAEGSGRIASFPGCLPCVWAQGVWFALLAARAHCWLMWDLLPTSTPRPPFPGAFSCLCSVKLYGECLTGLLRTLSSSAQAWPLTLAVSGSFFCLWIVPWPWMRIVPALSPRIVVRGCTQPFHWHTWPQADASSV